MFNLLKCVLNLSIRTKCPTQLVPEGTKYCTSLNQSIVVNFTPLHVTICTRKFSSKKDKQLMDYVPRNFNDLDQKNKDTFIQVIDTFKEITRQKTGHVEFIDSALKYMKDFGVHKDLEVYKELINVLPKGKMVPENFIQSEFMHYPKQQNCIINLLEQMEENGVIPDWETQTILINIFGERGYPVRKYYRMMYWMPKFRNASPWILPNPVPSDTFLLAKLAIERIMSVDTRAKVTVYDSADIPDAIDDTWIVSGISEAQRGLIATHPKEMSIYVEGGFRIWLRDQSIVYYILRSDPDPEKEYVQEDPDDLRNLIDPFLIPDLFELKKKERSVHEQEDGIILAVAATGTSSQDSLLSWVRALEKDGNPRLGEVPILFTMKSPLGKTEGNGEIESAPLSSLKQRVGGDRNRSSGEIDSNEKKTIR
uniref:Evolutionarily conserved signaling intermediate in Toll pathway, mitochondrial n=1 Tax=Cacopsylla melanoneura TaxID=428564 RepID=A0A8D8PX25_9HEMI